MSHQTEGLALLATDGVFSMDGDIAPLTELSAAARSHRAMLYVDDAHGFGVVGKNGQGSAINAGLGPVEVPLQLVTLGKAFGVYGAVVVGSDILIEHLAQTAKTHIYTTALPPAIAAAALESHQRVMHDDWRRERLVEHIACFRELAQQQGIPILQSQTPIQGVLCGEKHRALAMACLLENSGYFVRAIRPPTVPDGTARLRITLSAVHTKKQIQGLIQELSKIHDGNTILKLSSEHDECQRE